jgi:hypothetical protein
MLADGGEAIRDLALLRDQPAVFGTVASTPTAWRVLAATDASALSTLRAARATARETAWMQAAATCKHGVLASFSVGCAVTAPIRQAIRALPTRVWHPAPEQDGTQRTGADVAELTGMPDLPGCPRAPASSCAANGPTPAPSSPCSTRTKGCATRPSSPTPLRGRRIA